MLPQPDILIAEIQSVPSWRQAIPIAGAAHIDPGDLLGADHAPIMRAPIDGFQRMGSAAALSLSINVTEVAVVSKSSFTAAVATASPLAILLEISTWEQCYSLLRVWNNLLPHKRDKIFTWP